MALWIWEDSFNISTEVILAQGAKEPGGTIPPDVPYVPGGPEESVTIRGFGLTTSEKNTEKSKWGTYQTYTNKENVSISGWVTGVSGKRVDEGSWKWDVTVSLKIPYGGA